MTALFTLCIGFFIGWMLCLKEQVRKIRKYQDNVLNEPLLKWIVANDIAEILIPQTPEERKEWFRSIAGVIGIVLIGFTFVAVLEMFL